MPMEPTVVTLPAFTLAGFTYESNLEEAINGKLVEQTYAQLQEARSEVGMLSGKEVYLLQSYPCHIAGFNPMVHAFKQMVAVPVDAFDALHPAMQVTEVPEGRFVKYRYNGPEAGLAAAYDFLYRSWMPEQGLMPGSFDFECWSPQYVPGAEEMEITLYIRIEES